DVHQIEEAIVVDGAAQGGVQLEAWVIGDAGQVDDSMAPGQHSAQQVRIAQVALDLYQVGMVLHRIEDALPEDVQVQDLHSVALGEQPGHQHGADVACTTRDKHCLDCAHLESSLNQSRAESFQATSSRCSSLNSPP